MLNESEDRVVYEDPEPEPEPELTPEPESELTPEPEPELTPEPEPEITPEPEPWPILGRRFMTKQTVKWVKKGGRWKRIRA